MRPPAETGVGTIVYSSTVGTRSVQRCPPSAIYILRRNQSIYIFCFSLHYLIFQSHHCGYFEMLPASLRRCALRWGFGLRSFGYRRAIPADSTDATLTGGTFCSVSLNSKSSLSKFLKCTGF